MADQWYYAQQGQRQGPVSDEELKQLASSGQLKPTDKVWKKGMVAWEAASAVEGLIPKPAENEPPPIPSEDEPPPVPPEDLPPPVPQQAVPWTVMARECLDHTLQSPLAVIGIALIVSSFLPFLLGLWGLLHLSMAGILGSLQNGFVFAAGFLMWRKKDYRIALVASILLVFGWLWMPAGILKCVSAVIALPIGIWSFLTLRKPDLRQQFVNQNDLVAPATQRIMAKLGIQATPQNASRVELAVMGGVYALAVIFAVVAANPPSRIVGTWTKGDSHSLRFTSDSVVMEREIVMKYSLKDASLTFHVSGAAIDMLLAKAGAGRAAAPGKTLPMAMDAAFPVEFVSDDEMILGTPDDAGLGKLLSGEWHRVKAAEKEKDDKGVTATPNHKERRTDSTSGHEESETGNEHRTDSTSGPEESKTAADNPNELRGKSQEDVVAALGKPDSVFTGGTLVGGVDDEVWSYHDRVKHKVTGTLQTIQVHFNHGKVVQVGLD